MARKVRLKPPSGGDRRSAKRYGHRCLRVHAALASADGSSRAARGLVRGEREERVFEVVGDDLDIPCRGRRQQIPGHCIGISRLDEDAVAADLDRADARQSRERSLVGLGQARPDGSAARQVPDLGRRPIGHDPPLPEQDDPVRVGVCLLEVVGGEQHRAAALRVTTDRGPEVAPALHVHSRRGLVESHQRRVGQQCQGEPEALLFTAGAFPHEAIGEMADPRPVEHLVHRSRFGVQATRSGEPSRCTVRSLSRPPVCRTADTRPRETAVDGDIPRTRTRPLIRLAEAQDHVDRGGLAGSVGAEQRRDLTKLEVKIDAVDGAHGAEAPVHVLAGRWRLRVPESRPPRDSTGLR